MFKILKVDYELKKNNFDYIKLNKDNIESSLLYSYLVWLYNLKFNLSVVVLFLFI